MVWNRRRELPYRKWRTTFEKHIPQCPNGSNRIVPSQFTRHEQRALGQVDVAWHENAWKRTTCIRGRPILRSMYQDNYLTNHYALWQRSKQGDRKDESQIGWSKSQSQNYSARCSNAGEKRKRRESKARGTDWSWKSCETSSDPAAISLAHRWCKSWTKREPSKWRSSRFDSRNEQ